MKASHSVLVALLAVVLASCSDSSTDSPADSAADTTPKGPGIVGEWTLDTTLMLSGLRNEINAHLVVTADSQSVDTLEKYNNDGGDIEDRFYYTKRRWTAVGNDVVFTKTLCRMTDNFGDWATVNCSAPVRDTVVGGLSSDLTSFRIRESGSGVLVFHKRK